MRIGVIQATSQRDKNALLYQCTTNAVKQDRHEVINFGCYPDEPGSFSYIDIAVAVSLLLASGAVDFVVTGCSSGQGMMLACNSLPNVLCGYVENPQDAGHAAFKEDQCSDKAKGDRCIGTDGWSADTKGASKKECCCIYYGIWQGS